MTRIPLAAAASLAALIAAASFFAPPATAADAPAIAWTVETVDGANGADRPNFAYALDPGATVTDAMRVTNTGTTALDLAVYAADAFTTSTGDIDLNTTDTPSVDAGAWVTVEAGQLVLAPGAQADVTFSITVPADATPGDHSAGLVTSFRGGTSGGTIDVDRRLGTRITVRVAGELAPAVEVAAVDTSYRPSWNPFEPGTLVVRYRLTNAGNTLVTATDATRASGPWGIAETRPEPAALPEIIPGSTVDVVREVPIAPWGWVTGTVVTEPESIGFGAQGLATVTREFGVLAVPWTLLGVFVLIAGAIVAVWIARRRRMRQAGGPGGPRASGAVSAPTA